MGSRKAKIQPQMAVSGYADIFSIKVDSKVKIASEMPVPHSLGKEFSP